MAYPNFLYSSKLYSEVPVRTGAFLVAYYSSSDKANDVKSLFVCPPDGDSWTYCGKNDIYAELENTSVSLDYSNADLGVAKFYDCTSDLTSLTVTNAVSGEEPQTIMFVKFKTGEGFQLNLEGFTYLDEEVGTIPDLAEGYTYLLTIRNGFVTIDSSLRLDLTSATNEDIDGIFEDSETSEDIKLLINVSNLRHFWNIAKESSKQSDWDESNNNDATFVKNRTHYKGPIIGIQYSDITKTTDNSVIYAEGSSITHVGKSTKFALGATYKVTLETIPGMEAPDWAGEYIFTAEDLGRNTGEPAYYERIGGSLYGGKLQIFTQIGNSNNTHDASLYIKGKNSWEQSNLNCYVKIEIDESQDICKQEISTSTSWSSFIPDNDTLLAYPGIGLEFRKFYNIKFGDNEYTDIMPIEIIGKNRTVKVGSSTFDVSGDLIFCSSGKLDGENEWAFDFKKATGTFVNIATSTAMSSVDFSIKSSSIQILKYLESYWLTGSLLVEGQGENSVQFNLAYGALGKNSMASGEMTVAYGLDSNASGGYTLASGSFSHAEGGNNSPNGIYISYSSDGIYTSYGDYSKYSGSYIIDDKLYYISSANYNSSSDQTTFYIQNYTKQGSFSVNVFVNIASGFASHVEGRGTFALQDSAHAEGNNCIASGSSSHAEGSSCTASGGSSHAEGSDTKSTGLNSHSEGYGTEASGSASHAEGNHSVSSGQNSHAEGSNTIATGTNAHVGGMFNEPDTDIVAPDWASGIYHKGDKVKRWNTLYICIVDTSSSSWVYNEWISMSGLQHYAEIIGNGFDNSNRSNARTLDWDGNEWLAGNLIIGGEKIGHSSSGMSFSQNSDNNDIVRIDSVSSQGTSGYEPYIEIVPGLNYSGSILSKVRHPSGYGAYLSLNNTVAELFSATTIIDSYGKATIRSQSSTIDINAYEGVNFIGGPTNGIKKAISTTSCTPDTYYCPSTNPTETSPIVFDDTNFQGMYNYMFSGYFENDSSDPMQNMPDRTLTSQTINIEWFGDGMEAGKKYMFCATKISASNYIGVVTKLN